AGGIADREDARIDLTAGADDLVPVEEVVADRGAEVVGDSKASLEGDLGNHSERVAGGAADVARTGEGAAGGGDRGHAAADNGVGAEDVYLLMVAAQSELGRQ